MISKSLKETEKIARSLADKVREGGLICLYGDLGSGKTVFVKGLAEGLGLNKFSIKSPTYTYIRNQAHLHHIDLYRLEKVDELLWQEISELLENPKNIIVIEWADRLQGKLPKKRIDVHFKYIDGETREVITESV